MTCARPQSSLSGARTLSHPLVFMFSGQGSQYFHMARGLFNDCPPFRRHLLALDVIAEAELHCSLLGVLFDSGRKRSDPFNRTLFTHPALYIVQLALAETLREFGVIPDYLLGTSLGAYVAASAATSFTPREILSLLIQQARILEASPDGGGMIAILAEPALYERHPQLRNNCEVAGINFESHFVVSGPTTGLALVEGFLRQNGIDFQRLAVSHAFHSRWMACVEDPVHRQLQAVGSRRATVPLICCADCCEYNRISGDFLWRAGRFPIRFRDTIRFLEQRGTYRYVDLSPSGTLATFLKYCLPRHSGSEVVSIMTPFGDELQNLNDFLAACAGPSART
jgi:bacillaene synthase trans-acting acyltransferase